MVGVDSSCSFSTNHGIDKTGQLAWMLVTDLLNPIPTFCLFVLNFDPLSSTTFVSLAGSVMTTNDPVIMRLSSNVLTEQHSLCFLCLSHQKHSSMDPFGNRNQVQSRNYKSLLIAAYFTLLAHQLSWGFLQYPFSNVWLHTLVTSFH